MEDSNVVLGFRPIEEETLVCMGCDNKLVTLMLVSKEFPHQWVFQAYCPCGDSSEPVEKSGKILYNAVEPLKIVAAPVNKNGDVFEVKLVTK